LYYRLAYGKTQGNSFRSSLLIRKKNYPSIRKKLWGNAFWSPSYFAGSCGGAPIGIIRQYIEQQRTPH
jgi:putative transposase